MARLASLSLLCLALLCGALLSHAIDPRARWYYAQWCHAYGADSLQYLDDGLCAKVFPASLARDWAAPLRASSQPDSAQGWALEPEDMTRLQVNTTALPPLIGTANLCVILIRRFEGQVYYRHLCGEGDADVNVVQPWSSTKIYALANAGGRLRESCSGEQGLTSTTAGKHGMTPLGDLATVVVSYDETAGYSSNGLSRYAHDVGGRERLLHTLRTWWPPAHFANLSLGGNYGEPAPTDLGFTFAAADRGAPNCTVTPNPTPQPPLPNALNMLAHADLLRRLVLHTDLPEASRWPNLTQADVTELLYGSEASLLWPDEQWGGMSVDPGIFVQSGLPMDEVAAASLGQFRIFSKLGAGYSDAGFGQTVTVAYAALPVLNQSGQPVPDRGVEFVLAARSSVLGDTTLANAELVLQQAVANVVKAIYMERL